MNVFLLSAGVTAFLVGLAHSALGEILIFKKLRRRGLVPTEGRNLLPESNVRIIWASWHIVTVFGWCLASILVWLSQNSVENMQSLLIERAISISMSLGSILVLIGTRGKHPGWIGLLLVAALSWFGTLPGRTSLSLMTDFEISSIGLATENNRRGIWGQEHYFLLFYFRDSLLIT